MFLEPRINNHYHKDKVGWIEVVCGSMFSGKTEELIRRVNRAVIAQQKVKIFKPAIDTRYDELDVVSHNQNKVESVPIHNSKEILDQINDADVIAIDEAQFFDLELVEVCTELANSGYRVIICGLDMDFEGKPFGPIPMLMSVAEFVTKLHAICVVCGDTALYSYRLVDSNEKVLLGEQNQYEARCRKCYLDGMNEQKKKTDQLIESGEK